MTDKLTETVEREPVTAVSAEMARIRGLFDKGGDGDREDLITYAKEIVKLRAALHPIDEAGLRAILDDAEIARDTAGFLGSVGDCIRYLDSELQENRAALPIDEGVTQADRDAAAGYCRDPLFWSPQIIFAMRDGTMDAHPLVQAFRAHRVAALRGSQS